MTAFKILAWSSAQRLLRQLALKGTLAPRLHDSTALRSPRPQPPIMAVLKLRTDGSVDEVGAASSSPAAEAPTQATMASSSMMVTPETLTAAMGTGGGEKSGVSTVAVKETVELPPVMLTLVKPQILRFKATEIQSHFLSFC